MTDGGDVGKQQRSGSGPGTGQDQDWPGPSGLLSLDLVPPEIRGHVNSWHRLSDGLVWEEPPGPPGLLPSGPCGAVRRDSHQAAGPGGGAWPVP